jgi:hypothetical protein
MASSPDGWNGLWSEVGPRTGWFRSLYPSLLKWQSSPGLPLDSDEARRRLLFHATRETDWLFHPCSRVFFDSLASESQDELNVQFLVWAAINDPSGPWAFTLSNAVTVWTPAGLEDLEPGVHSPASLLRSFDPTTSYSPALDICSRCVSAVYPSTWTINIPFDANQQRVLKSEICIFLRALDNLRACSPSAMAWVNHSTRVVVPCVARGDGRVRSASREDHIGVVFMDITSEVEVLETLVHEAAHHHFYLYDCQERLVERDDDSLFFSPLRNTLRPLRGVFLAYHALTYMLAFYHSAALGGVLDTHASIGPRMELVAAQYKQAASSMQAARERLTEAGKRLLATLERLGNFDLSE